MLALLEGEAAELLLNGLLALSFCPFKSEQRVLRIETTKSGAVGIESVVVVIYKCLQEKDRPQHLLQALDYMPGRPISRLVTADFPAADLANVLWVGHRKGLFLLANCLLDRVQDSTRRSRSKVLAASSIEISLF